MKCPLTDREILEAWEAAFDKDVPVHHFPTAEDIIVLRCKAVIKKVLEKLSEGKRNCVGAKKS